MQEKKNHIFSYEAGLYILLFCDIILHFPEFIQTAVNKQPRTDYIVCTEPLIVHGMLNMHVD